MAGHVPNTNDAIIAILSAVQHLGAHVLEQIRMVAAATPRAQVLTRAERTLSELAGR